MGPQATQRDQSELGFCIAAGLPDQGHNPAVTLSHPATLPSRDLDGKPHKAPPLGGENDRVFNDLWGKGNVPVVLNNPYSENEQVSEALARWTLRSHTSLGMEEGGGRKA